jgi:uncharacterized membrane protein (UPF0127 family)
VWLKVDGRRVGPAELAGSFRRRARGLLGRDGIAGGLLIRQAVSIHTLGMRFPIDVAFCDKNLVVSEIVTMVPNRLGRPRFGSRAVLEAEAGAFARWGLVRGSRLALTEVAD